MKHSLLGIVLLAAFSAFAQDAQNTPFGRYRTATGMPLILCAQAVEIAALKQRLNKPLEPGESPRQCIQAAQNDARRAYADLERTLKGKPAASQALKAAQAAFATAIQGVMPDDGEIKITYRARLTAQRARVTEAVERLRLEL